MNDAWLHIIETLEPMVFKWKEELEQGPGIKPILTRRGRGWQICLEEIWPENSDGSYQITESSIMLDDIVEWTEKELTKWKDCRRTAWDMWQFKSKRDAEKFITVFYITWAK